MCINVGFILKECTFLGPGKQGQIVYSIKLINKQKTEQTNKRTHRGKNGEKKYKNLQISHIEAKI